MLNVVVTMQPKQDKIVEFEKTLGELLDIVRQEPGCHGVTWGPVKGASTYGIVEVYTDEEARKAHLATEAMKTYGPLLAGLFESAPTAFIFEDI